MTTGRTLDQDVHEGAMFLVDKPPDWSSFDVVNKMRGIFHIKKIGHAGTLDRTATGLLIVCTGKRTKELTAYQSLDKEYDVTMRLGERTESFDKETPVIERYDSSIVTDEEIHRVAGTFIGRQTQVPPMWSAAKVGGKRLYNYARKGMVVQRRERQVVIHDICIEKIDNPYVHMSVTCSKGTYVRTLVDEMGTRLGVGAHVMQLRRTRIGEYTVRDAVTLDEMILHRNVHPN